MYSYTERACVCCICEVETHDFTLCSIQFKILITVDLHHIPIPPHECAVSLLQSKWHNRVILSQEDVIEHDHFLTIDWVIHIGFDWCDENVSVQSQILLQIFTHMSVIPVNAFIRNFHG